jgi:hypothetical protein
MSAKIESIGKEDEEEKEEEEDGGASLKLYDSFLDFNTGFWTPDLDP